MFTVLLLMVIVLCKVVRCVTISFLSKYEQIRLFEILEIYLIALRLISFSIAKASWRLISNAWMIASSFVGDESSFAA